jgi:hypothetical protein
MVINLLEFKSVKKNIKSCLINKRSIFREFFSIDSKIMDLVLLKKIPHLLKIYNEKIPYIQKRINAFFVKKL